MTKTIITLGSVLGVLVVLLVANLASGLKSNTIVLDPSNHTEIVGEISMESINKNMQEIANSSPSKTFYIYIQTPGGSVFAGKRLVDYLRVTDRKIVCIADIAISMGFHILEDGCRTRLVTEGAVLMSHQISFGAQGSLAEVEASVQLSRKIEDYLDSLTSQRLGLTLKEYQAKLNPEFWMVGHPEILLNKAADGVSIVVCDRTLETSHKCPMM